MTIKYDTIEQTRSKSWMFENYLWGFWNDSKLMQKFVNFAYFVNLVDTIALSDEKIYYVGFNKLSFLDVAVPRGLVQSLFCNLSYTHFMQKMWRMAMCNISVHSNDYEDFNWQSLIADSKKQGLIWKIQQPGMLNVLPLLELPDLSMPPLFVWQLPLLWFPCAALLLRRERTSLLSGTST